MHHLPTSLCRSRRLVSAPAALALACALLAPAAQAQTDNFNDGNDNGWTHYDPLGGLGAGPRGVFSVVNGAYRIQALASPSPAGAGPGRVAGLRSDVTYSRFYITVDVVNWNPNLNQSFGILARINTPGLGTTAGYAFTYQTSGHDVQISSITAEAPTDVSPTVSVTLNPTNRYRFVLEGNGAQLVGRVYLASDLSTPLAVASGNNSLYGSGIAGLLVYDASSGGNATADATFDNYFASDIQPPTLTYETTLFHEIFVYWPQDYAEFMLQGATNLSSPGQWMDLGFGEAAGNQRLYYEGSAEGNKFFRLIRP